MATDGSRPRTAAPSSLAGLVRAWRQRLFLTQQELSDSSGLAVRTIRRLESGSIRQPRSESLRLLADSLHLTADERTQLIAAARDPGRDATPRQLPPDVVGFAGRRGPLSHLTVELSGGTQPRGKVVVVCGMAGVGKTALAVHAAHQMARWFPGGQLYVNLRGFDPSGAPMAAAEALRGFLDALGVPQHRVPADLHAQAGLYRTLLATRQVLVVLDNASTAEQVRPLLPGGARCLVLVTSRSSLSGLLTGEGACAIALDPLPTAEARELLALRVGVDRVAAEPRAVDEILDRCARLPLALAIAAARAATRPEFPLAAIAAELRAGRGLDAFDNDDPATSLRTVFSWSYHTISPDSARLLRGLGLYAGPDIGLAAAASLAGCTRARVRHLLAELVRAHLVTERAPSRYELHDLLRIYAAELARAHDPDADRRTAGHRMLDSYLGTAVRAAWLLNRHRVPITLTAAERGVTVEPIATAKLAITVHHRARRTPRGRRPG